MGCAVPTLATLRPAAAAARGEWRGRVGCSGGGGVSGGAPPRLCAGPARVWSPAPAAAAHTQLRLVRNKRSMNLGSAPGGMGAGVALTSQLGRYGSRRAGLVTRALEEGGGGADASPSEPSGAEEVDALAAGPSHHLTFISSVTVGP
jgi:hypothetical protein